MYLIHLHNLSDPQQGTNTKEYNVMVSFKIKFNKYPTTLSSSNT
jgi:hypothetical protein